MPCSRVDRRSAAINHSSASMVSRSRCRGSVQHPQVAIPTTQRQTSRRRRQVGGRPAVLIAEQSHGSHTGRPLPDDVDSRRHLRTSSIAGAPQRNWLRGARRPRGLGRACGGGQGPPRPRRRRLLLGHTKDERCRHYRRLQALAGTPLATVEFIRERLGELDVERPALRHLDERRALRAARGRAPEGTGPTAGRPRR